MAWIESHQGLKDHPKTLMLANAMKWSVFETIGRLHTFWWWCLEYAPTGDLRKFNDAILAQSVALNASEGSLFVAAMVEARWLDRSQNVLKVHDWVEYAGRYLRDTKFKNKPEKWKEVVALYRTSSTDLPTAVDSDLPTADTVSAESQPKVSRKSAENPLYQTKPTKPTKPTNQPTAGGLGFKSLVDKLRVHGVRGNVEAVVRNYGEANVEDVLARLKLKADAGESFKDVGGWIVSQLKLDYSDLPPESDIERKMQELTKSEAYARGHCPPTGKTMRMLAIEKLRNGNGVDSRVV